MRTPVRPKRVTRERGSVRFGEAEIEYRVTRSSRRVKTVSIRLEPGEGVIVSAPMRACSEQIQEIVRTRAGWILRRAAAAPPPLEKRAFLSGESLPYLGRQLRLSVTQTKARRVSLRLERSILFIETPAALTDEEQRTAIERVLTRWYRERASECLQERVQHWIPPAGSAPRAVLIRDQRRRWGSCSADGTLRFNWRLVMAEPELIDYVVVHELAHLRVKNHSAAFWAGVARLMPDYRLRRVRLREVGPSLVL